MWENRMLLKNNNNNNMEIGLTIISGNVYWNQFENVSWNESENIFGRILKSFLKNSFGRIIKKTFS